MKIAAIQPLSLSDFPGHCAAIIFTVGCNLRCSYCHNKNLWDDSHKQISEQETLDFLRAKIKKLDGVVITGGEPTIYSDLISFIKKIKDLGFKVKLNTNGTNPDCVKKLVDQNLLDYIAMDIKAPFSLYEKVCGAKISIEDIQKNISMISSSKIPHEFRTTWDKELLSEADIEAIQKLIPKTSRHVVQTKLSG